MQAPCQRRLRFGKSYSSRIKGVSAPLEGWKGVADFGRPEARDRPKAPWKLGLRAFPDLAGAGFWAAVVFMA
jgi:hypothetical protein